MNRKLKQKIKLAFNTPKSTKKDEFLQSFTFPKARYSDFIINQIAYIRKRVWFISSILLLIVFCGLRFLPTDETLKLICIISSLLPFVALVTITEILRSSAYNMIELEMSCKYSLSDIILVRLYAIGGYNVIIFTLILLLLIGKIDYSILQLSVYIFTPFMLSCTISLVVLNYLKIRETAFVCGGTSCFISVLNITLFNSKQAIFSDEFLLLWYGVFLILLFGTFFQIIKLIKRTEDLGWNLQLTD